MCERLDLAWPGLPIGKWLLLINARAALRRMCAAPRAAHHIHHTHHSAGGAGGRGAAQHSTARARHRESRLPCCAVLDAGGAERDGMKTSLNGG